jgi:hypothetical protein
VTRAEGPNLPSAWHAAVNLDDSPQDPAEPLGSPLLQTETQITDTTSRPVPACPAVTPITANPVVRAAMRTAVTKIDAGLNLADHAIPPPQACWPANPQPTRPVCHNGVICAA